jgi:hypothetical protein
VRRDVRLADLADHTHVLAVVRVERAVQHALHHRDGQIRAPTCTIDHNGRDMGTAVIMRDDSLADLRWRRPANPALPVDHRYGSPLDTWPPSRDAGQQNMNTTTFTTTVHIATVTQGGGT